MGSNLIKKNKEKQMKKKLLMLGASMLILGNSQISYGAAAFALEDDPSRRMSVPGERVGAALKDQIAREDEAMARHEAARTKALEAAAAAGEPDEGIKRKFFRAIDLPDEDIVEINYKLTDEEGMEEIEKKEVKRETETIWTEASHDSAGHFSVPRIRVYGEDEEGNRHYVEGEKLGTPVVHELVDEGVWTNSGDSHEVGDKIYQSKKRTKTYKRVGIDGLTYEVQEDDVNITDKPMARPTAPAPTPAPSTDEEPKRENTKTVLDKVEKECTVM